jgi:hypothetical protein
MTRGVRRGRAIRYDEEGVPIQPTQQGNIGDNQLNEDGRAVPPTRQGRGPGKTRQASANPKDHPEVNYIIHVYLCLNMYSRYFIYGIYFTDSGLLEVNCINMFI